MDKFSKFIDKIFVFFVICFLPLEAIEGTSLMENLSKVQVPFNYPLNMTVYPSQNKEASVLLCLHGYGGNYQLGAVMSQNVSNETIVSFDFPDAHRKNVLDVSYGSIREILPAIFVAKACILAGNLSKMSLYGFSAGAGALVNMLAVLNRQDYDSQLAAIGISQGDKKRILDAIQKGYVIIDCPLKSVEEIIDFRGRYPELVDLANKYANNNLRPIDSIFNLKGLTLNVIINFQTPDEAVTNRDDRLFVERFKSVNPNGRTIVVISHDQGHISYHPALWAALRKFQAEVR